MPITVDPLPSSLERTVFHTWLDQDGGVPLRCCLRDSHPGEQVAVASVTPPGPQGAYRESGPVFLHPESCTGPDTAGYPEDFRRRPQVFRAYDAQGSIVGGELVEAGIDQEWVAERLLADPEVAFLQTRNVVHGCYMLTIRRVAALD